ncbi:hypothetical protein [Streptomyces sp. NPDC005303]|uniref:hypothetical protein n=1 Tax=Streptomyces sp. NPDC005303 TaxID=3155713 RepID=UPI0033A9FC81
MNPDLYSAWLAAGDRLQPVGAWLAGDGAWVPIAAVAAVIVWRTWRIRPRDDYRSRNDRRQAAWLAFCEDRPEPAEPGSNDDDLLTCLHILAATNNARKERES